LRGVENAIATPLSTSTPYFSTLYKVLLQTRVAAITLSCTFETGIVIPTSDSVFMNLCKLKIILRSPLLFTRFFPPFSNISKL
jgi:hypothetical protein